MRMSQTSVIYERLSAVQDVTGLERKLAVNLQHLDVAAGGVNIHSASARP